MSFDYLFEGLGSFDIWKVPFICFICDRFGGAFSFFLALAREATRDTTSRYSRLGSILHV